LSTPAPGISIAEESGSPGLEVASIARDPHELGHLPAELAAGGITAKDFPADITSPAPRQQRTKAALFYRDETMSAQSGTGLGSGQGRRRPQPGEHARRKEQRLDRKQWRQSYLTVRHRRSKH
jgi:hypothetical protein